MPDHNNTSLHNAARTLVSEHGIKGLSLRALAQEAGVSAGSISYNIGDKAALTRFIIARETEDRIALHQQWLRRTASLDLTVPQVLATVIAAYLDEAAGPRRKASVTGCELLLEATRQPSLYPVAPLLDAEDCFWSEMIGPDHPAGSDLGLAIAAYCRDELPFTMAAGANPDYLLLRAVTLMRLTQGLAGNGDSYSRSFDGLVTALGNATTATPLMIDLTAGTRRMELADHIADIIIEQGVTPVTHRLVAAQAGVSNSTITHYFHTRDELVEAGLGVLILRVRHNLSTGAIHHQNSVDNRSGLALISATHSIALAASRDRRLIASALDMRRRRAENVRATYTQRIGGNEGLDAAAVQATVMALVGSGLASQAVGPATARPLLTIETFTRMRLAAGAVDLK